MTTQTNWPPRNPGRFRSKKHACCEQKLMTQKGVGGERGYNKDGTAFTHGPRAQMPGERYWDFRRRISGTTWPDACALDTSGTPAKYYDFKFSCPAGVPVKMTRAGVPTRRKDGTDILATGNSRASIGEKQMAKYLSLADKQGIEPPDNIPGEISNEDC